MRDLSVRQVAVRAGVLVSGLPPVSFAISQITDGTFNTTEYRSLHHALRAIEPMLRDGKLILEGKELRELWTPRVEREWGQFGRLLPRELLGNVLLALVLNPLPNTCGIVVAADPYNTDGMLYNAVTGEAWVLEHVLVPGRTPMTPHGAGRPVVDLVLEQIAHKHKDKSSIRGPDYLRGKVLFVLINEAGMWVPDDVVKRLSAPPSVNAIMVAQRTGKTDAGDFVYHVVRLDWVLRCAPRWRLTIQADLSSWEVVREQ